MALMRVIWQCELLDTTPVVSNYSFRTPLRLGALISPLFSCVHIIIAIIIGCCCCCCCGAGVVPWDRMG